MTTTTFTESVSSNSADPIFSFAASGDRLVVEEGVTLSNPRGAPVDGRGVQGLHDLSAVIDGALSGGGWAALDAFGSSIDISVGGTGRIESAGAMAVEASDASTLDNAGTITASRGFGVVFADARTASVVNSGTVFGEVGALEFAFTKPGSSVSVTNHGVLQGGSGAHDVVGGAGSNQTIYSDADSTTILNTAQILADDRAGAAIKIVDGSLALQNDGEIRSSLYIGVVVEGSVGAEIVNGGTITGYRGALSLSSGADTVTNNGFLDGRVMLGSGADVFHGENGLGAGAVWGQAGRDLLIGSAHDDILGGGSAIDTLRGGAGDDVLTGARGADLLVGGTGEDFFRFLTAAEASGDQIVAGDGAAAFEGAGTAGGDLLDLSRIDADTTLAGKQDFVFGTSHARGHLWAEDVGDVTHIRGNTAGGTAPEFDLAIVDGTGIHAGDYVREDFIF